MSQKLTKRTRHENEENKRQIIHEHYNINYKLETKNVFVNITINNTTRKVKLKKQMTETTRIIKSQERKQLSVELEIHVTPNCKKQIQESYQRDN